MQINSGPGFKATLTCNRAEISRDFCVSDSSVFVLLAKRQMALVKPSCAIVEIPSDEHSEGVEVQTAVQAKSISTHNCTRATTYTILKRRLASLQQQATGMGQRRDCDSSLLILHIVGFFSQFDDT